MKYTLSFLFGFILFSFSLLAQNFPVSYKISRSFDECSQCNTKTRSTWTLMNKGSFSSQDLKDAIEMKIFTEKSYGEKVGYYFSEQDYEKECPETISGKHVWIPNQTIEKDQITSSQFQDYVSNEKNRVQSEKQKAEEEKRRKEEEKAKGFDSCKLFLREYSDLKDLRLKADDLKQKNDIENYLNTLEQVFYKWRTLSSLYGNYEQRWYYDDYYELKEIRQTINEYYNTRQKSRYSDANNFVTNALKMKKIEKAYTLINLFFKDYSYNFKDFVEGSELGMKLAANLSYAALLSKKNKDFWYYQRSAAASYDQNVKIKWYNMMINDINEFEKLDILQNVDSIKFVISAYCQHIMIKVSDYSSTNTKNSFKNNTRLRGFLLRINENFDIKDENSNKQPISKVITIDQNLYFFKYPQYHKSEGGPIRVTYIRFYFYLNNLGDVIIVNKSGNNPSVKKQTKIIEKSKEIRDKDLNLVPQN
jgi:hypothetical protein